MEHVGRHTGVIPSTVEYICMCEASQAFATSYCVCVCLCPAVAATGAEGSQAQVTTFGSCSFGAEVFQQPGTKTWQSIGGATCKVNIMPCRVMCAVPCAVCRVPCAVCRVPCAVCRVPCAVCRVPCRVMPCRVCLVFEEGVITEDVLCSSQHLSSRHAMRCSAGNAAQCSAVQCSAVQCSAVQCSAVQCSASQQRLWLTYLAVCMCPALPLLLLLLLLLLQVLIVPEGLTLVGIAGWAGDSWDQVGYMVQGWHTLTAVKCACAGSLHIHPQPCQCCSARSVCTSCLSCTHQCLKYLQQRAVGSTGSSRLGLLRNSGGGIRAIDLRSHCAMQHRISITKVETWTKLEASLPP
jgi:hypothetical protein